MVRRLPGVTGFLAIASMAIAAGSWGWGEMLPQATLDEVAGLEAAARAAEELAEETRSASERARGRALEARRRADAAHRRANEASAALRRIRDELGLPATKARARLTPEQFQERFAVEKTKHPAAERSPEENKKRYLGRTRANRAGLFRRRVQESFTYSPGGAPDMADLEIRSGGQWAINVARGSASFAGARPGSVPKTGHVDYARLDIRPAGGRHSTMKWGIRRFNMGDVTVRDCDFTGIPKEHGIYDEVGAHALYSGNTFQDLGGQAIQMAYRDKPFQQYGASNMPFTAPATYILEDNHAVDTGQDPSRSGFVWTFFDPGTHRHPGTVILRGCTSVQCWARARTIDGPSVELDDPRAVQSPGGLVVQHYQHVAPGKPPATSWLVVTNCLFDHTKSTMPIAAIRGVETILIQDSCLLARDHRNPVVDVDDLPGMPSGRVILQNNVSPPEMEVWLQVRGRRVCSMHCPGQRIEIDVKTLGVSRSEPADEPMARLVSPLNDRRPAPGIHPQPAGHVDDIGAVRLRYR